MIQDRVDFGDVKNLLLMILDRLDKLERRLEERDEEESAELLYLAVRLFRLSSMAVNVADAAERLVSLRRLLSSKKVSEDISRAIIEILAVMGPMNISRLTRELRRYRGKASRRIVARKIRRLAEEGLIEVRRVGREKVVKIKGDL